MKPIAMLITAALGLSACTSYQPSKANCFDKNIVSRSANNLTVLSTMNSEPVTRGTSHNDCVFTPVGGASEIRGQ